MTTPYIFEGKSLVGARGCLLDGKGVGGGRGLLHLNVTWLLVELTCIGGISNGGYTLVMKNQLIFIIKRQC